VFYIVGFAICLIHSNHGGGTKEPFLKNKNKSSFRKQIFGSNKKVPHKTFCSGIFNVL
jgi:hypothetical protein